jgi:hypothetical protein
MAEGEAIPGFEGQVSCEYCRKSIPRSSALQPEAEEYMVYFCGLECYEAWRKQAAAEPGSAQGQ